MKKTTLLLLLLICQFSIILTSCVSKSIPIPGDKQKQITNIYIEYMNIADIYFGEEKYDKAITYYEMAMQYKQLYWDCYYKLAKSYAYQSNWTKSREMFETLLKRDPNNSSLKESMAYINAMSGEVDKALKQYDQLIKDQPENADFLVNYIAVILLNERLDDVIVPFMALQNQFPDNTNIEKFQAQIDKLVEKIEAERKLEEDKNNKSDDSDLDSNEDTEDDDDSDED